MLPRVRFDGNGDQLRHNLSFFFSNSGGLRKVLRRGMTARRWDGVRVAIRALGTRSGQVSVGGDDGHGSGGRGKEKNEAM